MANQNLQRLERCLDVRALIETQQDVEELLASMVAKQRLWLFKQQKRRFVFSKSSTVDQQSSFKVKQNLIQLFESYLDDKDVQLLQGVLKVDAAPHKQS